MKIIPLYPKFKKQIIYITEEIIEVADDECLYCFGYINEDEIFCCDECQLAFDEENPEPELKDVE